MVDKKEDSKESSKEELSEEELINEFLENEVFPKYNVSSEQGFILKNPERIDLDKKGRPINKKGTFRGLIKSKNVKKLTMMEFVGKGNLTGHLRNWLELFPSGNFTLKVKVSKKETNQKDENGNYYWGWSFYCESINNETQKHYLEYMKNKKSKKSSKK